MAELLAEIHGTKELALTLREWADQAPFGLSVGLNTTANAIQSGIRAGLAQRFRLRQPQFIERTIYRRPGVWPAGDNATKRSLAAAVRVHPDRDFLAKFEEGGSKTARSGSVAVPILRVSEPGRIIKRSDPYHLSKLPGGARAPQRTKRHNAFVVQSAGKKVILERMGDSRVRVLWAFRSSVPIPQKLGFIDTAARVFNQTWLQNVQAGMDRAIKTRRP